MIGGVRYVVVVVLTMTALSMVGCPRMKPQKPEPKPGQTEAELAAAARIIEKVRGGIPLIEVTVDTASGTEKHTTTGFVLTADGWIVCGTEALEPSSSQPEEALERSVQAIFHAGTQEEWSYSCTVVREDQQVGLALLEADTEGLTALKLGGRVEPGTPVFALTHPLGMRALAAQAGKALGYVETPAGPSLRHNAGVEFGGPGPVVDERGEVLGLTNAGGEDGERVAIAAERIAAWLESLPTETVAPTATPDSLRAMLERAGLIFREEDQRFALPYDNGITVNVGRRGRLIVLSVNLPELPAGDAVQALRWNYADPYGRLALTPEGALVYKATIMAEFCSPRYLKTVADATAVRAKAWIDDPTAVSLDDVGDVYPDGDADVLGPRLQRIVAACGLPYEGEVDTFSLTPESGPKVWVSLYRGVAYVYLFSGGMPGADEAEQERIGRELLTWNWRSPLCRLALDSYHDLACEAQVPMDYLQPQYLAVIAQECARLVEEIRARYGEVPFNEQD